MFIMWIGQMVALLDKPEAAAIHDVIVDIASTYPQVVIVDIASTYPQVVIVDIASTYPQV
jgi:hypothetical protein